MKHLTFRTLRAANLIRLPQFKNKHGKLAHSMSDGSDWSVSDWIEAVLGELGEFANGHKKFRRGDMTAEEWKVYAAKELADVAIYLDILAMRCLDTPGMPDALGVDLGQAVQDKFNEVSERVGANVTIENNSIYRHGILDEQGVDKAVDFGITDCKAPSGLPLPKFKIGDHVYPSRINLADRPTIWMVERINYRVVKQCWRYVMSAPGFGLTGEDEDALTKTDEPVTVFP